MREITKQERHHILSCYPKTQIVSTTNKKYYLLGKETDPPNRLLNRIRGIAEPPTRRGSLHIEEREECEEWE